jgi:hypothetical protein
LVRRVYTNRMCVLGNNADLDKLFRGGQHSKEGQDSAQTDHFSGCTSQHEAQECQELALAP